MVERGMAARSVVMLAHLVLLFAIIAGVSSGQDLFPPNFQSLRVSTVGETWFEVEWETDEPSLGGVEWGRDGSYTNLTREVGSYGYEHFLNVTGLRKGTVYAFRVFAEDLHGNLGYSKGHEVGTLPLGQDEGGLSAAAWVATVVVVCIAIGFLLLRRP